MKIRNNLKQIREHFRGCLMGGAVGNALGWPVEFRTCESIKRKFGPLGMRDLVLGASETAEVTDDLK